MAQNESNKNKALNFFTKVVFIVILLLIFWGISDAVNNYLIIPQKKNKIKQDLAFGNDAKIKEIGNINRVSGAHTFNYIYKVGNKSYSNKITIGLYFKPNGGHYLMEKSLPVAYEIGNPENSRLLITPEDFEYFDIPFPDSLQWIKEDVLK